MEFNYEARNEDGGHIAGTIDAPNKEQAIVILQKKNLLIVSLESADTGLLNKDFNNYFDKPKKKDVVIFTQQLATLIDADIPLLEGLGILSDQTVKASFKKVIQQVSQSIEGGASLSVALAEHDTVFNSFYINLVKVGEVSGKMQETLVYLAEYLERSAALTSKIKSALYYPTFVLMAMALVVTIMMTSVIPQLLSIVEDAGATELPMSTRFLIFTTDFINQYLLLIIGVILVVIIWSYYYVRTESGHYKWDRFKITVPRFGHIVQNLYIARMAETLSTLIKAGVPILEGIKITSAVVGNDVYKKILLEAENSVRGGGTMSASFKEHEEIPILASSMLYTGEKTGRVDFMLNNILKFYETEAENSINNIAQLIEPVLILILGAGVAVLVSAVLLPIYSVIG